MLYSQDQRKRINGYLNTINFEVYNTNLRAKEIKNILVNGSMPMNLLNDLTSNDIENNKINQDREFFQKTYALFKGNSGEVAMLRQRLEAENLIVFYLTHLPRILSLVKLIRSPTSQNIYIIVKRLYQQELKDLEKPTENKINTDWNKIKILLFNISDTLDNYKREISDTNDLNQVQLRINKIHTLFQFIASANDKEKYIKKLFDLSPQELIQELVSITQIRPLDHWFEYLRMLDYVLLSTVTKDSLLDILKEQEANDDYDDADDAASIVSDISIPESIILADLDRILTMDIQGQHTPPLSPTQYQWGESKGDPPPLSPTQSPPLSPTQQQYDAYLQYKLNDYNRPITPQMRYFDWQAADMETELYEEFKNTIEQALPLLYDKMQGFTSINGSNIDEGLDILTEDLVDKHGQAFGQLLTVNNLQSLRQPITIEKYRQIRDGNILQPPPAGPPQQSGPISALQPAVPIRDHKKPPLPPQLPPPKPAQPTVINNNRPPPPIQIIRPPPVDLFQQIQNQAQNMQNSNEAIEAKINKNNIAAAQQNKPDTMYNALTDAFNKIRPQIDADSDTDSDTDSNSSWISGAGFKESNRDKINLEIDQMKFQELKAILSDLKLPNKRSDTKKQLVQTLKQYFNKL
jgi:hypothetical protein